ncbi:hypothetical protein [Bremerella cremea]|uniref:hypothetical protein n=1 Tax=Bremerella cremea TaxID=1031537 RepID=UPI0031E6015E
MFNPSQYQDIGTTVGYCLKHNSLLKSSSHTTCRFLRRKDLPSFVAEESELEHAEEFKDTSGIVFYYGKVKHEKRRYSEKHAWQTNDFDQRLHDVAIYYKTRKRWVFLQALQGSRNPVINLIQSCLVRRYISNCGSSVDNYRLILAVTQDLLESIELKVADFRYEISPDEFKQLKDGYQRDVVLIRLYAVQEYGHLIKNDNIKWISDELNGSFLSSWEEYSLAVRQLVPTIRRRIIEQAEKKGVFFTTKPANKDELNLE